MSEHTAESIKRGVRYKVNHGIITFTSVIWLLILCAAPWCWGSADIQFRLFGTGLQVIGVLTVAVGIRRTRRDLGDATLFQQLSAFLNFPPPISGDANITLKGVSAVSFIGHVSPPEPANGAPISEVVAWTKSQIELVEKNLKAKAEALNNRLSTVDDRAQAEINARGELNQQVDKLKQLTKSGLNLSAFGVVCLLVGVIYGTLPSDLHHLAVVFFGAR